MWFHAVNSIPDLKSIFSQHEQEEFNLELDIILNYADEVVVCHGPKIPDGAPLLRDYLHELLRLLGSRPSPVVPVVKFDFKHRDLVSCFGALAPSLAQFPASTRVMFNADVLRGPGGGAPFIDAGLFARAFERAIGARAPLGAQLSWGWTVGVPFVDRPPGYEPHHVREMAECLRAQEAFVRSFSGVQFPLHGAYARASWEHLRKLGEGGRRQFLLFGMFEHEEFEQLRAFAEANHIEFDCQEI